MYEMTWLKYLSVEHFCMHVLYEVCFVHFIKNLVHARIFIFIVKLVILIK